MRIEHRIFSVSELKLLLDMTNRKFNGQREYKEWSLEKKVLFLESMFLEYPTPPFFIGKTPDGFTYLIDGQHRFKTFGEILETVKSVVLFPETAENKKIITELQDIQLERSEKTAYAFIKNNFDKLSETIMKYRVAVTFINFNNLAEVDADGSLVFNYLNSTRRDIPDGDIIKNKLVSSGLSFKVIESLENEISSHVKYSQGKIAEHIPFLDAIRSTFFANEKYTSPKGVSNISIPDLVSSEINNSKDFVKKIVELVNTNFYQKFYEHINKEKIGFNVKNSTSVATQSSYVYPALAVSISRNKFDCIDNACFQKHLEIIDELANREMYAQYKSYVHGAVRKTATSILLLEGILDGNINGTEDFIKKYFS